MKQYPSRLVRNRRGYRHVGIGTAAERAVVPDVGTWSPIGAVSDARVGAASVTLADGRTLIAGGRLSDGTITDSVVGLRPDDQRVRGRGPVAGRTPDTGGRPTEGRSRDGGRRRS